MIRKLIISAATVAAVAALTAAPAAADHDHSLETPGACVDRNGAGFGGAEQVHEDDSADPGDTTFHERIHKGTPGQFAFERGGGRVSVHGALCPESD